MPISCKGRVRNVDPSRGDVDDALGNFSLTMIDALDSLFLLNEVEEFESAVKHVINSTSFNADLDVSVFETNIRILGGLLGAHVSALEIKKKDNSRMAWYSNELLQMAVDIGNRLLPAFNTSTGIPIPRINLRHGSVGLKRQEIHTCTACAGTMILEFAALSRLTGNPVYEEKAERAMASLWKQRSRYSDLMGSVIDVHSGDWIRRESGIGAGIDSYYEYLLKAFIILGEPVYLHRFHIHYEAIKRHLSSPGSATFPFFFINVNMHKPSEHTRSFMDALYAFWPGLQVLTGDVKSAVAVHEFLFQVYKRNKLLPEAFTADLRVHWGEHLLRPELAESTYLLYRATNDPYYIEVGAQLVSDLQTYTRVPCGFAAIEDVRTMKHIDRFDSFVLAETFKYLYLLFSEPSDLPISLSEFEFTTEGHLLPLSLSQHRYSPIIKSLGDAGSLKSTHVPPPIPTDHHGDRDHLAEAVLQHTGTCPIIHSGSAFPHRLSAPPAPFNASKSSDDPWSFVSSVWDGPGWAQTILTRPNHTKPRICRSHTRSTDQLNARMWNSIDRIRQLPREMAIRLNEASAEIDWKQQAGTGQSILSATEFRPDNTQHLALLRRMGIELSIDSDNRMVLRHDQQTADNAPSAVSGLLFIQELLALAKARQKNEESVVSDRYVVVLNPPNFGRLRFTACPAHFGHFPGETPSEQTEQAASGAQSATPPDPKPTVTESVSADSGLSNWKPVVAPVLIARPFTGCSPISDVGSAYPPESLPWNSQEPLTHDSVDPKLVDSSKPLAGAIGMVRRGGCLFIDKARNLARAGAIGGIVLDTDATSSADKSIMFTMSSEGDTEGNVDEVTLPFMLLFGQERDRLLQEMRHHWDQTGQSTWLMLTKQFNMTAAFFDSLKLFEPDHSSTTNLPVGNFELRSKVGPDIAPISSKIPRLPSRTTGGFGLSRLPASSDQLYDTVTEQFLLSPATPPPSDSQQNIVGSSWVLTLFGDSVEELAEYYSSTGDDGSGYPQRIEHWISALNQSMLAATIGPSCQGLLLALSEVVLQNATQPFVPPFQPPSLSLSSIWQASIDRCFQRLQDRARFQAAFHTPTYSSDPRTHVSIVVSFNPFLSDMASSF